jgi:hypothetical protein
VVLGKINRPVVAGSIACLPKCWTPKDPSARDRYPLGRRAGLRAYWRSRARRRSGRPRIPAHICHRILEMSVTNSLWGAHEFTVNCSARDRRRPDYEEKYALWPCGIRGGSFGGPSAEWIARQLTRPAAGVGGHDLPELPRSRRNLGEQHPCYLFNSYQAYYNKSRTGLAEEGRADFVTLTG